MFYCLFSVIKKQQGLNALLHLAWVVTKNFRIYRKKQKFLFYGLIQKYFSNTSPSLISLIPGLINKGVYI